MTKKELYQKLQHVNFEKYILLLCKKIPSILDIPNW